MPSVAAGREVDEAGYDDLRVGQTSRHSGRRKSRLRLSRRECAVLAGLVLLICGFGLRAVTQRLGWMNPTHFYSDQPLEILELGAIKWFHCPDVHVDGAECGVAVVPLDYNNASAGTANIALGRYKATSSARQGIILVNPGGPGMPGSRLATELGPYMQAMTGEDWDIVGFDPRGIGKSDPHISCFGSPTSYQLFRTNTVLDHGVDFASDMSEPVAHARLLHGLRQADALTAAQYEMCRVQGGKKLRYVGTTQVARDIDYITTLLEGKDALINFYGGSYGSALGQYVINMFPNRVGRVVIDGIAEATMWSSMPVHKWYRLMLTSSEDAYQRFLEACSQAGPDACALAKTRNDGPADIDGRIQGLLSTLYESPMHAVINRRAGLLTPGLARNYVFSALVRPRKWPDATRDIAAAIAGNAGPMLRGMLAHSALASDLENEAVTCADSSSAASTPPSPEEVTAEYTDIFANLSRWGLGHPTVAGPPCERWSAQLAPPERFQGPWNAKLRNPVLIVSNEADPVTPLSAGRSVHDLLKESSALLVQNSTGHCASALASLCTAHAIRAYFADGTLPASGTVCEVDEYPFGGGPLLAPEDALLLDRLRKFGEGLHGHVTPPPRRRVQE